ncbi:hypothetical protein J6N69_04845 [bacterium]|nr:hypothetical protein [bacterium]
MTDKNLNLLLSNINLCIAKTEGAEKEQFKEYKKIVENFQSRKQYQDGSEAFVAGNKSQQQNKEEQQIKSIYSAVNKKLKK